MGEVLEWFGMTTFAAFLAGCAVPCAVFGRGMGWSKAERRGWAAGALLMLTLAALFSAGGIHAARVMGGQD